MQAIETLTLIMAQAGAEGANPLVSMMPIILMFVVLYFLMIRPQMKRQKEHRNLVAGLSKGDEVITSGGLLGKVSKVHDNYLTIEVANLADKPVEILVQRVAVTTVLPKGTIMSLSCPRPRPQVRGCHFSTRRRYPMNRYPIWKYLIVLVALAIGLLYTLPNFFGESPAVQVSSAKSTVRVDS